MTPVSFNNVEIAPAGNRGLAAWLGGISLPLSVLAVAQAVSAAEQVGLRLWQSKSLLLAAVALAGMAAASLGVLVWAVAGWRVPLRIAVFGAKRERRAIGWPWLAAGGLWALLAPLLHWAVFSQTALGALFAPSLAARLLLFWLLALLAALVMWRVGVAGLGSAVLLALLAGGLGWQAFGLLAQVSATPFSQGWSEGSRLYMPSLFLAQKIYSQPLHWPIMNPSLQWMLLPPYLAEAPIWAHRLWRGLLLFGLSAATGWALARRLGLAGWPRRWAGLLFGLYALTLPVYTHLLPPLLVLLLWFGRGKRWQSLAVLLLASAWAGLSRVNWYPVPAMLAIALDLTDNPARRPRWLDVARYAGWFALGSGTAALAMQAYVRASGAAASDFFTVLRSTLIFERLLPSETFWLGVAPARVLFGLPWAGLWWLAWRKGGVPPAARGWGAWLLGGLLAALLAGGLLVSTKIGGGNDIHNLDAFGMLLVLLAAMALAGGFGLRPAQPLRLPWGWVLALVLVPAFFANLQLATVTAYQPESWRVALRGIQAAVDAGNAAGKPVLFISQRQLPAMGYITGVEMPGLYDREDLMEMAMSDDAAVLEDFAGKLKAHTWSAIVVDELIFTYKGTADAFGYEHNAWSKWVIKPILCHYQLQQVYPNEKAAVYVPRQGQPSCPTLPKKP